MRRHHVAEACRFHWKVVGHQVVQQHAKAVDVAPDRRLVSKQHFWRHVEGRADNSPADRTHFRSLLPRAEVHQDQAATFLTHHVLSLDVAVHQAGNMYGSQGATEFEPDESGFAATERAMAAEHLLE